MSDHILKSFRPEVTQTEIDAFDHAVRDIVVNRNFKSPILIPDIVNDFGLHLRDSIEQGSTIPKAWSLGDQQSLEKFIREKTNKNQWSNRIDFQKSMEESGVNPQAVSPKKVVFSDKGEISLQNVKWDTHIAPEIYSNEYLHGYTNPFIEKQDEAFYLENFGSQETKPNSEAEVSDSSPSVDDPDTNKRSEVGSPDESMQQDESTDDTIQDIKQVLERKKQEADRQKAEKILLEEKAVRDAKSAIESGTNEASKRVNAESDTMADHQIQPIEGLFLLALKGIGKRRIDFHNSRIESEIERAKNLYVMAENAPSDNRKDILHKKLAKSVENINYRIDRYSSVASRSSTAGKTRIAENLNDRSKDFKALIEKIEKIDSPEINKVVKMANERLKQIAELTQKLANAIGSVFSR